MRIVMVSGSVNRPAERKTSKAGKDYVAISIKAKEAKGVSYWRAIAFSKSTASDLMRLNPGDPIAVTGKLSTGTYEGRDGKTRVDLTVMVDGLMTMPS